MSIRYFISLIRDLLVLMPSHAEKEWEEVGLLNPSQSTIVLVSGFGATRRSLTVMRRRLMNEGYNVLVLALDLQNVSDAFKGFFELAQRLSSLVLLLRKKLGMKNKKIYIVAHSAGGLAARYYVQYLGGDHYCDALVTLGTPHKGTKLAFLGFFTHLIIKIRCVYQLLPFSGFIKQLNEIDLPQGFKMLSLSSSSDFICSKNASELPVKIKENSEVVSKTLSRLSHSDFLVSKKSHEVILEYLRAQEVSEHAKSAKQPQVLKIEKK